MDAADTGNDSDSTRIDNNANNTMENKVQDTTDNAMENDDAKDLQDKVKDTCHEVKVTDNVMVTEPAVTQTEEEGQEELGEHVAADDSSSRQAENQDIETECSGLTPDLHSPQS